MTQNAMLSLSLEETTERPIKYLENAENESAKFWEL